MSITGLNDQGLKYNLPFEVFWVGLKEVASRSNAAVVDLWPFWDISIIGDL